MLWSKKKGEGRCSSSPAKFTVIGKFLVGGEGIEGRKGAGWKEDGEEKEGKAPITRF